MAIPSPPYTAEAGAVTRVRALVNNLYGRTFTDAAHTSIPGTIP